MTNSIYRAIAGCSIIGNMQTLTAAMGGDRIGNAYKLAAAMNPMTGAMAALNAMNPCRALDLRSPAERVFSHVLEERAAWGRALSAVLGERVRYTRTPEEETEAKMKVMRQLYGEPNQPQEGVQA